MARVRDWFQPAEAASPIFDRAGNDLPGWRDKGVWILLVFVLLLELLAWRQAEGYPVADAVEFMERARTLVRGEHLIDAGQIRPYGFSLLLAPVYLLADWIGLADPRPVSWAICLLQIACGLVLVTVCVRLGARLGGRRTGLVAGFLVGTNPVFLCYSAMPISGLCAAICIGLGLESLWERGNARREWIGALWLAASVLMIYQCALIVAALAACILLRDRRRALRGLRTLALALGLALTLQFLLDRPVYGSFGVSLETYGAQKGGGLLASICLKLWSVTHLQFLKDWSQAIARAVFSSQGTLPDAGSAVVSDVVHSKQPFDWYFVHLPQMLAWPVLLLFVAALWKGLRRPNWLVSTAWLVLGANVAAMTFSPVKDFRLWLPLLPFLAPLCASGGAAFWSALGDRPRAARENTFWRRSLTFGMALSCALLSLTPFLRQNRREFAGYWHAIDFVNELAARSHAARGAQAPKLRVAFDYNWAVYQRESPLVELVKLPAQLSLWNTKALTRARKQELLSVLPGLDLLVVHQPVLSTNPDLFESVNRDYVVCGALYDRRTYQPGLGPLYVLARRGASAAEACFFEIEREADPQSFAKLHGLEKGVEFAREDGSELLELLGSEFRTLPPEGLGWITYHWYSPTGLHTPWTLIDRLTAPDEVNAWQNNHAPAWGTLASENWPARARVSESYLVVPETDPYDSRGPFRPLGGAYKHGEQIPLRLWISIVHYDPLALAQGRAVELGRLPPRLRAPKEPLSPAADGTFFSPDGAQWSGDDMLRVGSFTMPVQPSARALDER